MKKTILILSLVFILSSFASAVLLVTDSGVSIGNNNKIGERRSSWDYSQGNEMIAAWMKIPPGSDQENGAVRYQYKVKVFAPDQTTFIEGPFNFESDGYARSFKTVSYYAGLKTSLFPRPAEGEWKIELVIVDNQQNKEDLGALVPFYMTGSDRTQAPTDLSQAGQKAVDETLDMSMLAVFNTAKQYGAQQEQQRQTETATMTATTSPTTTATTGNNPPKKSSPKKSGKKKK